MSSGSYFTILRKSKQNTEFSEAFILNFMQQKYKEDTLIGNNEQIDINKYEQLVNYLTNYWPITTFKYLSIKDRCDLDIIMQLHFLSNFTILKEEYNLNPYNKFSYKEFSSVEAKEMLIAIDYILSKEYSYRFEQILNNYYIEMYGQMIPYFQYRFNKKLLNENTYQESFDEEIESIRILKKVRDTLNAYLLIQNENVLNEAKYILLYSCY